METRHVLRAEDALMSSAKMCSLLAEARSHKVPGYWEGSCYKKHPCGLITGTIKFTNDWTTHSACRIEITDGLGWTTTNISKDPQSNGDPHPPSIGGVSFVAWRNGTWVSQELKDKLHPKFVNVLSKVVEQIEETKDKVSKDNEEKALKKEEERLKALDKAIERALQYPEEK